MVQGLGHWEYHCSFLDLIGDWVHIGCYAPELDAGRRPRNNLAVHAKDIRSSYDHRARLVRRVADSKHHDALLDVRHNPVQARYDVRRSLGYDDTSSLHSLLNTWAAQQGYPQTPQVPLELATVWAEACKVRLQVRIHAADGREKESDVEGSLQLGHDNRRYPDLSHRPEISKLVAVEVCIPKHMFRQRNTSEQEKIKSPKRLYDMAMLFRMGSFYPAVTKVSQNFY